MAGDLAHPDPARRVAAIRGLRYRDLKDPAVLELALRACRDPTPAPDPGEDPAETDPFAAFFAAGPARPSATVASVAAARLRRTGLPPDDASLAVLVRVLAEDGPPGELPGLAARALAETRWASLDRALEALVPALDRHDQPLFEAIVALPSDAVPVLARLAAAPLRPRLLQELLNHPPSHAAAVAAAERAVLDALPDGPADPELHTVLGVLAAWGEPAAARIARAATARAQWAIAWGAAIDPALSAALEAWLDAGSPEAPERLFPRVSEVLRQRGLPDGFPLAAWLRAAGDDHGLCRTWGIEAPGVDEVLGSWVRDLAAPARRDRGWTAAALLAGAGRHARVVGVLEEAVAAGWLPWEEQVLTALAGADPPIRGLGAAIAARAPLDDPGPGVPALLALDAEARRALVERAIAAAAAAARTTVRVGRGIVREQPVGVALEPLEPLVASLADPALAARVEAVAPVIRAG